MSTKVKKILQAHPASDVAGKNSNALAFSVGGLQMFAPLPFNKIFQTAIQIIFGANCGGAIQAGIMKTGF